LSAPPSAPIAGTWFVCPTPFEDAGGLDLASVESLVEASIPAGRYGGAPEFAAAVGFLAAEAASCVTGTYLSCDGGMARGWI
jgi:NAD(P)-dependent dehydrogenase (short-subunit alcohol dehydrogenase family)